MTTFAESPCVIAAAVCKVIGKERKVVLPAKELPGLVKEALAPESPRTTEEQVCEVLTHFRQRTSMLHFNRNTRNVTLVLDQFYPYATRVFAPGANDPESDKVKVRRLLGDS